MPGSTKNANKQASNKKNSMKKLNNFGNTTNLQEYMNIS